MNSTDIEQTIQETYSRAAREIGTMPCCCPVDYRSVFPAADLAHLPPELLDRNFGCGIPARLLSLAPGQRVLDLGPGLGRDCFLAAAGVGATGRVYGLDRNPDMLDRARRHAKAVAASLGYANVEFLEGRFDEFIPLPSESIDVIVSNCVNNLATDKRRAYAEMFRVLKPGAALSFADVVVDRPNPPALAAHPQAVADCIGGSLSFTELLKALVEAGFVGAHLDVRFVFRNGEDVLKRYFPGGSGLAADEARTISQRTYFSVNVLALRHRFPAGVGSELAGQRALYHGPAEVFRLHADCEFPRGAWVEIDPRTAWLLVQEPFRAQFTVIGSSGIVEAPSCGLPGCC